MRYLSVCAGIEAATVAWHPLGWEPAAFSEIDGFPRAVLAHHYPEVPLHGDFTTIGADDYGAIDLLVGGTPCQSFSIAGLRGGLADDRGNLALEFLRLADRKRPRWVVWENVPGVFSSLSHDAPDLCPPNINLDAGDGPADGEEVLVEDSYDADESHAFACFLAGLQELGYGVAYRVLDAQYAGVPQRRRRVFSVGYLGDWRRAAAVLFERHSLSGHPAPSREAREGSTARAAYGISPDCLDRSGDGAGGTASERSGLGLDHEIAYALRARRAGAVAAFGGGNTSGPIDIATAQTAHGVRMDFDTETFVTHALRGEGFDASEDGTGRGTPLVPVAYAIQERAVSENLESGPQGKGFQPDTAYTLEARNKVQSVAFSIMPMNSGKDYKARETDVAQPLMAGGPVGGNQGGGKPGQGYTAIRTGSAVRRLTPRECERLQGFPDDYTLIPYRGKPAADGPRYKALGNSMAVPVMRWIGERIAVVDAIAQEAQAA